MLPAGRWSLDEISEPARWIVYMGRFPDGQAMARKQAELAALQLRTEPIENPALANGLSLGGFDSQEKAVSELAALVTEARFYGAPVSPGEPALIRWRPGDTHPLPLAGSPPLARIASASMRWRSACRSRSWPWSSRATACSPPP